MRLRLPLLVLSGLGSLALANGLDDKMRSGLDLTMMDRTFVIKTPEDIVKFASGSWMTKTVIPNDKTLIDTFAEVANRNLDVLHDILDHVSTAEPESLDASARKVGLFYRVAMDGAKANQLGVKPITQELEEIDKISDRSELMLVIGDLQRKGVTNTFTFSIDQDDLNERRVLPSFAQGGILIPDPDLYLGMASAIVRPVYVKTFAKLLAIAGHSETAKAEAEQSFAFEKDLAKLSSTPVEMRNVAANYHVLDWQTFEKSTPSIDWKSFTKAAGLPTLTEGIVRQAKFFNGLDSLVKTAPLDQWKSYLRCRLMFTEAPFLSDDAQQALFDGFAALSGQKEQEARWKRAEHSTDSVLGESLGKLYVAKAFSPAAMVRTRKLIETILAALHDRIAAEPWMSAETKQKAQEKLRLVTIKVGYPKRWRDYARFEVKDDSWAANVLRGSEFEWDRQIKKLGKPIDRSEWSMTPPTVNAYYDSGANEIVFPAGILQAGFYDPLADNAANYGAIGMIIGHEITHGFDDRGRQFNGYGRRQDWWTPEDSKRYADLSAEILDQYSGLKNAFGQAINSKLTLSENIADVGGIALAYDAYHRSVNGKEPPVIDGFTGDQRFFLAAAQMYHGKAQKEWASFSLRLDVHSPTEIRAFAAASDQPAFYRAFNLVPPAHLPRLW